jgi:hypothetical protein
VQFLESYLRSSEQPDPWFAGIRMRFGKAAGSKPSVFCLLAQTREPMPFFIPAQALSGSRINLNIKHFHIDRFLKLAFLFKK